MPTKPNKAGKPQQYVPAGNGDASGEYGNESGSNKHFESFKQPKSESKFSKPFTKLTESKVVSDFREKTIKSKKEKLLASGESERDNINLDLSRKITPITDNDISAMVSSGIKPKVAKLAGNLIKKYEPVVDNIANDLLSATTKNGGLMIGLDFRLKRASSVARKIESDVIEAKDKGKTISYEDAANGIGDIARFTSCFDRENFQKSVDATIRTLQSQGYELVKFKNYFKQGSSYKGINCNFKDKNGNIFELQFHTPESMKIKEGYEIDIKNKKASVDKVMFQSHDIYETTRVLEDKIKEKTATQEEINTYNELKQHNIKMWDQIKDNYPDWTIDQYIKQPNKFSKFGK